MALQLTSSSRVASQIHHLHFLFGFEFLLRMATGHGCFFAPLSAIACPASRMLSHAQPRAWLGLPPFSLKSPPRFLAQGAWSNIHTASPSTRPSPPLSPPYASPLPTEELRCGQEQLTVVHNCHWPTHQRADGHGGSPLCLRHSKPFLPFP